MYETQWWHQSSIRMFSKHTFGELGDSCVSWYVEEMPRGVDWAHEAGESGVRWGEVMADTSDEIIQLPSKLNPDLLGLKYPHQWKMKPSVTDCTQAVQQQSPTLLRKNPAGSLGCQSFFHHYSSSGQTFLVWEETYFSILTRLTCKMNNVIYV